MMGWWRNEKESMQLLPMISRHNVTRLRLMSTLDFISRVFAGFWKSILYQCPNSVKVRDLFWPTSFSKKSSPAVKSQNIWTVEVVSSKIVKYRSLIPVEISKSFEISSFWKVDCCRLHPFLMFRKIQVIVGGTRSTSIVAFILGKTYRRCTRRVGHPSKWIASTHPAP
jgi:hypothetical protein